MPSRLGAAQWREDLAHLVAALRREHRNPFHGTSREAFDGAVRHLHARIPSLAGHEVVVELSRLVATLGDGHTALRLADVPGFRRYPLALYRYSDGLFVRAVGREHEAAAGARLLSVGGTPADEAYEAMRPIVSRDNEMGGRATAPALLTIPEVLHARGVIEAPARTTFDVERRGGERVALSLDPGDGLPAGLVDARDGASAPTPLLLRRSPEENGFDYLPDTRTLYLAYNCVRDGADEALATFFDRAFALVEREGAERLIVDLRLNHGGNNALNRPLIHHIVRSDRINRWGGLYAVIGRQTFSAAMNLAVDLERDTRVLFIGEPTGSSPNHYGENAAIVLPHSGLRATAAALWWQHSAPYDDRPWIAPDLPARLRAADYAANRDPAVETALTHIPDAATRFVEYPDRLAKLLRRDDLLLRHDGRSGAGRFQ